MICLYSISTHSTALAQTDIGTLIKNGSFEEARAKLPSLIKSKPNDPSTLYYQALLEKKGERSLKYFESLYDRYPKSNYADDALMQIGEYRYARGLYVSAERILLKIPRQYPDSEHVPRAINMLMQAMLVTGKADTAKMYLDVFKKRWKDLDVDLPVPDSEKDVEDIISDILDNKDAFTIQIGAFGSKDNAKRQRDVFKERGYRVSLGKKDVAGNTLHLVWIGQYSSYGEALSEARILKAKFGVNYGIIDRNKPK